MSLLQDQVAIVTGAGRGIGRGHALELARHGAKVVVNDVGGSVRGEGRGTDADQTVAVIEARGGVAKANYANVADDEECRHLIEETISEFGQLDILVNNAGIVRDRAVWNMPVEDFDAVMAVHVRGTWLGCHYASIHWRSRAKNGEDVRGRIINTTSGAGLVGNFGQSNYATAKAAIAGLTLTLSLELAGIGVTVNAVGPGGSTRLTATAPGADEVIDPATLGPDEYHPMDPAGSSPVVAWLASAEAQHVTGQVIRVIYDRIYLMKGWYEAVTVSSGGNRWDATKLGAIMATDVFGTRARGLTP